jgi:hypothetical protein
MPLYLVDKAEAIARESKFGRDNGNNKRSAMVAYFGEADVH